MTGFARHFLTQITRTTDAFASSNVSTVPSRKYRPNMPGARTVWNAAPEMTTNVLSSEGNLSQPVRVHPPATINGPNTQTAPMQTLAENEARKAQY